MKLRKKVRITRSLNVQVPISIYNTFHRKCFEYGISKTRAIVMYLEWLNDPKGWSNINAKFLHKDSGEDGKDFNLLER